MANNLTTLSINYVHPSDVGYSTINGLLYVPDLSPESICQNMSLTHVPATATRRENLPQANYKLIALVPWYDAACMAEYFQSASLDPVRAMLVYEPTNTTDQPPGPDSPTWDLDDGGAWRQSTHFPIYAVPGAAGRYMMQILSLYSGAVDEVPFAREIQEMYSPGHDDYVRIWTQLDISSPDVSNIWKYMLVFVSCLIVVFIAVSGSMHFIQFRRRQSLRERVIRGEVDLEAMGIKRMVLTSKRIDEFPVWTYHYDEGKRKRRQTAATRTAATSPTTQAPSGTDGLGGVRRSSKETGATAEASAQAATVTQEASVVKEAAIPEDDDIDDGLNYQPTCLICMRNFRNLSSTIKELDCGHVFHVRCAIVYLSRDSSLCPVCRASMLPAGYCPPITNDLVRRERALRQLRAAEAIEDDDDYEEDNGEEEGTEGGNGVARGWLAFRRARVKRRRRRKRRSVASLKRRLSWGSSMRSPPFSPTSPELPQLGHEVVPSRDGEVGAVGLPVQGNGDGARQPSSGK